jgi:uncharacterized protein (TIGR00296 family)
LERKPQTFKKVFVTIKKAADHSLRGCIGIVSPTPLFDAVQRASLSAAFSDPRFPSLKKDELETIIFEVSVMTEPSLVSGKNPAEMKEDIEIGSDGLLISNEPYGGLLLPQVPVEHGWDADEFLVNLCYKAGMTPSFLEDENTQVWKFQCQIFSEGLPKGKVKEVKLKQ